MALRAVATALTLTAGALLYPSEGQHELREQGEQIEQVKAHAANKKEKCSSRVFIGGVCVRPMIVLDWPLRFSQEPLGEMTVDCFIKSDNRSHQRKGGTWLGDYGSNDRARALEEGTRAGGDGNQKVVYESSLCDITGAPGPLHTYNTRSSLGGNPNVNPIIVSTDGSLSEHGASCIIDAFGRSNSARIEHFPWFDGGLIYEQTDDHLVQSFLLACATRQSPF